MKLHSLFLLFLLPLLFCSNQHDKGTISLKDLTLKAQKAGYNVTYKDSLKVNNPGQKIMVTPNSFGKANRSQDNTK
jgi:hypothetical protein